MGKIVAYLRASTDKQDLNHQKLELLEFARKKSLAIDEFVEITISSRKTSKQRRIDELLSMLNNGDTLLVTELSRLGRSTTEVITLVNSLAHHSIRVIVLKQNLDISQQDINSKVTLTLFSLFSELERDLIIKKRQGQILGKPKGTIQKSKFDKHAEKIKELLEYGLSVRKISSVLEYTNHIALNTYINKRNLKEKLQST
jgi:DNA invertase Pin-like site-specific DNA recombinase